MKSETGINGRVYATVLVSSLGHVLVQSNTVLLNLAVYRIEISFGADIAALQWIVNGYMLSFAALLLPGGALADRSGARTTFLRGLGVFGLGSLGMAVGSTVPGLIASQVLIGAGSALIVPCSLALLVRVCEDNSARRARSIAVWTAAGGSAVAFSPVLGGSLMTVAAWRNAFLADGVLCAIVVCLAIRSIGADPKRAPASFDMVGQALVALTLLGLIGGMIEGGRRGLIEPLVVGCFLVGLGAGAAAVGRHTRTVVLPPVIFRQPGFTAAIAVSCVTNVTYYGVVFVLGLYFQKLHGYSPAQAGLAFLPFNASFVLSSIAGGWLAAMYGPRVPLVLGSLVATIGYVLLYHSTTATGDSAVLTSFLLVPIGGAGLIAPAATDILLGSVPPERAGTAAAFLNTLRQGAGASGIAIFGLVAGGGPDQFLRGLAASFLASAVLFAAAALASELLLGRDIK